MLLTGILSCSCFKFRICLSSSCPHPATYNYICNPPWVKYHLTVYVIFGWSSPANLAPGAAPPLHCSWVIPLIPGMFNQAGRQGGALSHLHAFCLLWENIKLFWIISNIRPALYRRQQETKTLHASAPSNRKFLF